MSLEFTAHILHHLATLASHWEIAARWTTWISNKEQTEKVIHNKLSIFINKSSENIFAARIQPNTII